MNKKIKTILSYIGVALLGALTGVGALVGVSSCSQSEKTTTQLKSVATRKNAKIDFSRDYLGDDSLLYFVAKNYASNGEGVFYQGTISEDNSAIIGTNFRYGVGELTLIRGDTAVKTRLNFTPVLNGGVYKLQSLYFSVGTDTSTRQYIYKAYASEFVRSNCAFVGYINSSNGIEDFIWYINKFFDVYELQSDTYTLNNHINPYTWWNTSKNSPYVSYVTFESGQVTPIKTINMPMFYVGGLAFDKIRFSYSPVNSGEHFNVNGEQFIYTGNSNTYMTFIYASYYNSATQYELRFYQQEVTFGAYGYAGPTLQCAFNWTNLQLKTIQFFETPNQSVLNNLNDLNNTYQSVGYSTNTDLGLGNAFSLIGLAFSSVTGLLSISVLPGITLGLLLFLPLIAGIIVAIIWVVKR